MKLKYQGTTYALGNRQSKTMQALINAARRGAKVTGMEFQKQGSGVDYRKRVSELRDMGLPIQSRQVPGESYYEYWLGKDDPDKAYYAKLAQEAL